MSVSNATTIQGIRSGLVINNCEGEILHLNGDHIGALFNYKEEQGKVPLLTLGQQEAKKRLQNAAYLKDFLVFV